MILHRKSFQWCKLCLVLVKRRNASWTSQQVRSTFIDYFTLHGHKIVSSSSVIPQRGEGTYFTNAGMNQFKPIFLGECVPSSKLSSLKCVVNSQKCIRVGGKHNDLEDVGHDLMHHTFFEMLGNWSFGDYFKKEACALALDLLVNHYKIAEDRLYFTYFAGDANLGVHADEECRDVWLSLGIPKERVLPFGESDNFWSMAERGPCGPCTEIHYDHVGGRLAPQEVNSGSPMLVEIWNLVFMQYNRIDNTSLKQLPLKHVDTGMGLERLTALLNGSADNYKTDLFLPLFDIISKMSKSPGYQGSLSELDTSYRILVDHARMFTVAISDGLLPSNDNLGHKLRSIIHRCILLSRNIFKTEPNLLLPALVDSIVSSLSCAYPELESNKSRVCDIVSAAILYHDKQRDMATRSFDKMSARLKGTVLSGEIIHSLEMGHYGSSMSLEVISELAASKGLQLDLEQYKELKSVVQASNARLSLPQDRTTPLVKAMSAQGVATTVDSFKYFYGPLNESVYDFSALELGKGQVCGLSCDGKVINNLEEAQHGEMVLDSTCFYAEGGGQEADSGQIVSETGSFTVTEVVNRSGYVVHIGHVTDGYLFSGQTVKLTVFTDRREGCMRNHTATHLLNAALKKIFPSTQQEGSSITPYKLTFDFLALRPVESKHLQQVEEWVQTAIKLEQNICRNLMPLETALKMPGLKKLQNEVYPDTVSVISVGECDSNSISVELCGGTHVTNTSHLGAFCVTQLKTKSQNVKRITAVTGREAKQALLCGKLLRLVSEVLKSIDLQNPSLGPSWSVVIQAAHQLQVISQDHQERLLHNLQFVSDCDVTQQARLATMLAEVDKSLAWLNSILALEAADDDKCDGHSDNNNASSSILSTLMSVLKKGKDLDLVQKMAREEAHACLLRLGNKVTGVVNEKMMTNLRKNICDAVTQHEGRELLGCFVPKDFAPRQLVKVVQPGWNGWRHCSQLSLVHCGKKATTLVVFRRNCETGEETYEEFLKKLQQLASTKGKQVSVSGGDLDVFIFTIKNLTKQGESINENLIQSYLPYTWFHSR